MEKEYKWMVRVSCMTYNHAPYITDALNGFCMQETTFPFICTIVDDASTDGEQEVIKQYLQKHFDLEDGSIVRNEETDDYVLTFARHKTNKNCYFAVLYLKYNHYSVKKSKLPYIEKWCDNCKYIACCEGDDYWIDKTKLQKQVELLESHPKVSYTCTRYMKLNQATGVYSEGKNFYFDKKNNCEKEWFEFTKEDAFKNGWITKTLTSVFRGDLYDGEFLSRFKYRRDVHLVYMLLSSGNGVCFSSFSGVYRLNQYSTFGGRPKNEKILQNYNVYEEFYRLERDEILGHQLVKYYTKLVINNITPPRLPEKRLRYYAKFIYMPLMKYRNFCKRFFTS